MTLKLLTTKIKAAIITMLAAAVVLPLLLVSVPYIEFFNDMAVQPKLKAQGSYGWFSEQQQLPGRFQAPAGSVGQTVYPYKFPADEQAEIQAGEQLSNPVIPAMDNLRQGGRMFDIYCMVCHGRWGDGDGVVVGPERYPAPPALYTEQVDSYTDGRIYYIITRGKGQMPAYHRQVMPDDRWLMVNYVRVLQKKYQLETESNESANTK